MKVSSLAVLGLLVGCSGAPDGRHGGYLQPANGEGQAGYYDNGHESYSTVVGDSCVDTVELEVEFKGPNGETSTRIVPVECDVWWLDTGDDPDRDVVVVLADIEDVK